MCTCATVCACATMCACMHVLALGMCWRTQACECECRTSAVLYRHRCSANYATIAELLSSVRFRFVVDDLKPAPPYAPDNTSHAITNRSPSTRAQRISTRAIELQWPVRLHLCGGGAIKAPDGGGYDAHAASRAREQAQRHHCLNIYPRDQRNRACLQLESPSSQWEETAA